MTPGAQYQRPSPHDNLSTGVKNGSESNQNGDYPCQ